MLPGWYGVLLIVFMPVFSGPGNVREHMGRLGLGGAGLRTVDAKGRIG